MDIRKYGAALAVGVALLGGVAFTAITASAQDSDEDSHVIVVEGSDGKECIVTVDTEEFGIDAECESPSPTPTPSPNPTPSPTPSPSPSPSGSPSPTPAS